MLIIKSVEDKKLQEEFCLKCNTKYLADDMCYAAYVDDVFTGICQFTMNDEYGYIHDLRLIPNVEDFEAIFIMGRATMNFIDLRGVHTVRCPKNAGSERVLKAIGFQKEISKTEWEADMQGMFDGSHCASHHK